MHQCQFVNVKVRVTARDRVRSREGFAVVVSSPYVPSFCALISVAFCTWFPGFRNLRRPAFRVTWSGLVEGKSRSHNQGLRSREGASNNEGDAAH